jgi:chromosome segregation ATPase
MAGCETGRLAGLPPEPPPAPPAAQAGDLAGLARFGNTVRRLDARQLEQQYRQLELENDSVPTADAAIRLALLLSAPNAPFNDIDQATRFLRDVMYRENTSQPALRDFAQLLYNLFSERIYSESDDEPLQALLDQARERNDELSDELARARAALAEQRERAKTLEGQLNALKELEEQLSPDEPLG